MSEAEKDQKRLVEFFVGEGAQLGQLGDEYGWTPGQTAIQAMRELLRRYNRYPALGQLDVPN